MKLIDCAIAAVVAYFLLNGFINGQVSAVAGEPESLPLEAELFHEDSASLPTDLFQRCAQKVLAGEYGTIPQWKWDAYKCGAERGVTVAGKAWVTCYGPNEGRQGRVDNKGKPCTPRHAAANKIKRGRYVWVARAKKGGGATMRRVLDSGARSNDGVARSKGARLWIDIWYPHANNWSAVTYYAVIGE